MYWLTQMSIIRHSTTVSNVRQTVRCAGYFLVVVHAFTIEALYDRSIHPPTQLDGHIYTLAKSLGFMKKSAVVITRDQLVVIGKLS